MTTFVKSPDDGQHNRDYHHLSYFDAPQEHQDHHHQTSDFGIIVQSTNHINNHNDPSTRDGHDHEHNNFIEQQQQSTSYQRASPHFHHIPDDGIRKYEGESCYQVLH